jgi:hypothetical protein
MLTKRARDNRDDYASRNSINSLLTIIANKCANDLKIGEKLLD